MDVLRVASGSRLLFAACVVGLLAGPSNLPAQSLGISNAPGGADFPLWLSLWSPLSTSADLPRDLPGGEASLPSLLTKPAPRVGLFWLAGNPGALSFENLGSYSQIRTAYDRRSGDYRRPLDAGTESRTGGDAFGWKSLGSGGGVVGRVLVERLRRGDGTHETSVLPFSSNPFLVLDTLGDAMATTVMRLEGAGGWRLFGGLGIGLGLGFDGREVRTEASGVPRRYRASASGVTAGLVYDIAGGALRLGVYGRRVQTAQILSVYGYAGSSLEYVFSGYYDPVPFEILPGSSPFWRRGDGVAWAYGTSVGGRLLGVEWAAFGQVESAAEGHYGDGSAVFPDTDNWDTDGWTIGLSTQRLFGHNQYLATVLGRYTSLHGDAERLDLNEVVFTASEYSALLSGEIRMLPLYGWGAAAQVTLGRERRQRHDTLARIGSDLQHWAPGASVEITRNLPRGFAVSAAGGYALHAPWGEIPTPTRMSGPYEDWIAPELSLYGAKASSRTGAFTVLWSRSDGLSLWAQAKLASLSPTEDLGRLQYAPQGSRTRSRIEVGVTLGGGEGGRSNR